MNVFGVKGLSFVVPVTSAWGGIGYGEHLAKDTYYSPHWSQSHAAVKTIFKLDIWAMCEL